MNGESVPSIDKAQSLAKALGLSVGDLIGDYEANESLTEQDKRFISLSPLRKSLLLKFLDALEEQD